MTPWALKQEQVTELQITRGDYIGTKFRLEYVASGDGETWESCDTSLNGMPAKAVPSVVMA